MFSKSLEVTLNLVLSRAKEKRHEFMTVEHLLLALIENPEAVELLVACGANLQRLHAGLDILINETSRRAPPGQELNIQPTSAFHRVLQRAVIQAQSSGKTEVTGANVLIAILAEEESQAAYFLGQENVSRDRIIKHLSHGITRLSHYNEADMDNDRMNPPEMDPDAMQMESNESPLERYAINLNEQAKLGKIDPLIGRKVEIART